LDLVRSYSPPFFFFPQVSHFSEIFARSFPSPLAKFCFFWIGLDPASCLLVLQKFPLCPPGCVFAEGLFFFAFTFCAMSSQVPLEQDTPGFFCFLPWPFLPTSYFVFQFDVRGRTPPLLFIWSSSGIPRPLRVLKLLHGTSFRTRSVAIGFRA